jgi:hypothetical protein
MSSSKMFLLERDFAAGVYLSAAQNLIPPTHCIRVYSILVHTGEGGELSHREGERANRSQSWVENTNMTECSHEIGYHQAL